MRPDWSTVLSARHLASTLFVVLMTTAGAGGIVGVALAQGDAGGSIALARPMGGDSGRYEAVALDPELQGWVHTYTPFSAFEFEWLDDERLLAGDGVLRWAHQVATDVEDWIPWVNDYRFPISMVDPADGATLASVVPFVADPTEEGSFGVGWQDFEPDPATLPCGLWNPLQGVSVKEGSARPVPGDCLLNPGDAGDGSRILEVEGVEVVDGVRFALATMQGSGLPDGLQMWFREDIPYPIRIAASHPDFAWVLTEFSPGDRPLASHSAGEDPSLAVAALEMVDRTLTGPAEGGVDHPFPLAMALDLASQDSDMPRLQQFRKEHPDAYVVQADFLYTHQEYGNVTIHGWEFVLMDGSATHQAAYRMRVGHQVHGVPTPFPVVDYVGNEHPVEAWPLAGPAEDVPAAWVGPLPERMPTVASMWAQWRAYSNGTQEPNFWSFHRECNEAGWDCRVEYAAGYREDRVQETGRVGPIGRSGYGRDEIRRELVWEQAIQEDAVDYPTAMIRHEVTWGRGSGGASVEAQPEVLPQRQAVPVGIDGVWEMPGGKDGASIGLVAILAGIAYWAWPTLKVGMGLFSRVSEDILAAHPVRRRLLDAIAANPGVHHQELVRLVGKGKGTIAHHLAKLEAGRAIVCARNRGYACYFLPDQASRAALAAASALKSPVAQGILRAARERPGVPSADVARSLGVAGPTVHYHVARLRDAGLLSHDSEGLRPSA